jgi:two-component sensor histidine kinase
MAEVVSQQSVSAERVLLQELNHRINNEFASAISSHGLIGTLQTSCSLALRKRFLQVIAH